MKTTTHIKIWAALLLLAVIISGISPASRTVWFLELILVIIAFIIILLIYKRFKFSKGAYALIFVYLLLITIGAHYTYSKVPWEGLKDVLGTQRNPYDRFAHFSFGLLLYYPLLEIFVRTTKLKHKFWMYFVPITIIAGFGGIYEILEWITAVNVAPNTAQAFLGMQGDIWDTQKDMLFNILGGITTMIIVMVTKFFKKDDVTPDIREPRG